MNGSGNRPDRCFMKNKTAQNNSANISLSALSLNACCLINSRLLFYKKSLGIEIYNAIMYLHFVNSARNTFHWGEPLCQSLDIRVHWTWLTWFWLTCIARGWNPSARCTGHIFFWRLLCVISVRGGTWVMKSKKSHHKCHTHTLSVLHKFKLATYDDQVQLRVFKTKFHHWILELSEMNTVHKVNSRISFKAKYLNDWSEENFAL